MKIMYDVGDRVIVTNSSGVYYFAVGDMVTIVSVDRTAFIDGDGYYLVRSVDGIDAWVYDYNIKPATVSMLTQMNEMELTEYRDKMLEINNKKCLEFLAKNPSEYFSLEEIYKNANISFTSLKTLGRKLIAQSKLSHWRSDELGYKVSYHLKSNKKKYYGDDGSVLFRGKSELYFNAVAKVKEEYNYNDDEEEHEEDE